ncbi:MAG: hypothetical protein AVDCRST_MAG53-2503, partial [uncultured Solirubrobacteraceae bacterium]
APPGPRPALPGRYRTLRAGHKGQARRRPSAQAAGRAGRARPRLRRPEAVDVRRPAVRGPRDAPRPPQRPVGRPARPVDPRERRRLDGRRAPARHRAAGHRRPLAPARDAEPQPDSSGPDAAGPPVAVALARPGQPDLELERGQHQQASRGRGALVPRDPQGLSELHRPGRGPRRPPERRLLGPALHRCGRADSGRVGPAQLHRLEHLPDDEHARLPPRDQGRGVADGDRRRAQACTPVGALLRDGRAARRRGDELPAEADRPAGPRAHPARLPLLVEHRAEREELGLRGHRPRREGTPGAPRRALLPRRLQREARRRGSPGAAGGRHRPTRGRL